MLTHAYWALEDAGYTRDQLAKAGRTGVIVVVPRAAERRRSTSTRQRL